MYYIKQVKKEDKKNNPYKIDKGGSYSSGIAIAVFGVTGLLKGGIQYRGFRYVLCKK